MAAAFLVTALPWYLGLAFTGHGQVLNDFFHPPHLERATESLQPRPALLVLPPAPLLGLFPWSLFLPAAFFSPVRNEMERRGAFTPSSGSGRPAAGSRRRAPKRGVYLLPLYPAALLLAKFWDEVLSGTCRRA